MRIKIEFEENLDEDEVIIRCSKLNSTVQKIQQTVLNITSTISKLSFFKADKEYYFPLDEILFFETSGNNVDAHTVDDIYKVKYRLYELEEILPHSFVRVSKSTILNSNNIFSINRNLTSTNIVQFFKSHKEVYVSRFYFKSLKQRLEERRDYEK